MQRVKSTSKRRVSKRRVKRIPRRASRKQLPHVLKHFTLILTLTALTLGSLSIAFRSQSLLIGCIGVSLFCAAIDVLALAFQ